MKKAKKSPAAGGQAAVAFDVLGPFDVPYTRGCGTGFGSDNSREILDAAGAGEYADHVGCYVLARKHGRNLVPFYVGMTTKGFGAEVFSPANREKCCNALSLRSKGCLALFLVSAGATRRDGLARAIRQLEGDLISDAVKRNPDLVNKNQVPKRDYQINQITNPTPGQPSLPVQRFKRMLGY